MERLEIHYKDGKLTSNMDTIINNIYTCNKKELLLILKDAKKATSIGSSFKVLLNTVSKRLNSVKEMENRQSDGNFKGKSISMKPPKGYAPPQNTSKAPSKGFSFFDDSDGLVLPKALIFCAIVVTCSIFAFLLM